jgi:signal transduction histidine kinase
VPDTPCPVLGDRDRLKQAVVNLVGNALDAMRGQAGGTVRLSARMGGEGEVEVSVTDSGPGLDPQVVEQIFQPFVTTKPAGTGLGLSIVHRTMELHGGTVRLEPAPGRGTVATMRLPRAQ